jgi:hypothetical protein
MKGGRLILRLGFQTVDKLKRNRSMAELFSEKAGQNKLCSKGLGMEIWCFLIF